MRVAGIMMMAIVFQAATAHAAADAEPARRQGAIPLREADASRVQAVVTNWKAPAFAALPVVGMADPAPVPSVRPEPRLDQANALAAANEKQIGPCRFNETEWRIEVQQSAFRMSDDAFTRCLAGAYAQARYRGIEAEWLARLSEHEAWVARDGQLTKVAVESRIEKPAARLLWASFATRELTAEAQRASFSKEGRSIASEAGTRAPEPTVTERQVQELLGL